MKLSDSSGFRGMNPVTGEWLEREFHDARLRDIDAAVSAAGEASAWLRRQDGRQLQVLLESIAVALEGHRETIIELCRLETGYPLERVTGEFTRMVDGMRLFGRVALEGDWLNVRIDHADAKRLPIP